jgi:DNA-binding PadR family transcriptional regulator
MLTFGETSGYDLGKLVNRTVGHFFSPAKSQIYSELRRLVTVGYATERKIQQEDRPNKRLYRITKQGEQALRQWLESVDLEPPIYKIPFLLKLFFAAHTPYETLIAQVKEELRQSREVLEGFEELEREMQGKEEVFFPYLVLQAGLAHNRSQVDWAEQVLAELEERSQGYDPPAGTRED